MAVNSYTVVDIMKPTPTKIDLASSFNGRVGDSQSFTKLWFKRNGLPLDLTNYTLYLSGKDANGTAFKLVDYGKANQTGDNLQIGKVTFYFPAGTFQVEGDWDYTTTFFGIKDSSGTVISTVNVGIHVLGNSVDFGIDSKPFYTDLDELNKQMQDYINDKKGKIDSMLSEVLDKDSNLNQNLSSLTSLIETYQKLIDAKAIITQDDFNVFKKTVDDAIAKLSKDLVIENLGSANVTDARKPSFYISSYVQKMHTEYSNGVQLSGLPSGFYILETFTPFTDLASGAPMQRATLCTTNKAPMIYTRNGATADTWTVWTQITTW